MTKLNKIIYILWVFSFSCYVNCKDSVDVKIHDGKLRGKILQSKSGRNFNAFLGIPYAKPPLNELRFQPPQPIDSWDGIKSVQKTHAVCPQHDIFTGSTTYEGVEDCLYLNVYSPKITENKTELLPVMVWIHGGGWLCGSANNLFYGPEVLLDYEVVLVVPNYRLGALGFLSTGDEVAPGNNGMKDQHLALKWIQNNIRHFGGNSDKVTIFGQSSGAASVHYHMLSPLSKGLFHKAISQSGTALGLWAQSPKGENVRHAKKLGNALNCSTESSQDLVNCLRKIDAITIVKQDTVFMEWDIDPLIPFKPVVEPDVKGAFLTKDSVDIIKAGEAADIPWIVGINTEEGLLKTKLISNPHLIDELENDFNNKAAISMEYAPTANNPTAISKKIRQFYFGDKQININSSKELINMYSDAWWGSCTDASIRLHRKNKKNPIYYYLFGHKGKASFTTVLDSKSKLKGVCHNDELQYLFPFWDSTFANVSVSADDKKVGKFLTTLWTNFAINGDPTPETNDIISTKWKPVTSGNLEYYFIKSGDSFMKTNMFPDRTKFWRNLDYYSRKNETKN